MKMKNFFRLLILLCCLQSCFWQKKDAATYELDTLFVLTTDVFLNEDFYSEFFPVFEEIFKCRIEYTSYADAADILKALTEKNDSLRVDVVLGVDNTYFHMMMPDSIFLAYEPHNLRYADKNLIFDDSFHIVPVFYTQLAFIYNSYAIDKAPATFGEMQDGKFKNMIIMIHPESSSLGRGMLLWSVAAFGENGYGHFWRSVKANICSLAKNYDEAYNMFLAGQAPLVAGYSTTPVYHYRKDHSEKYRSTIPMEGSFNLITGAGIVKNTEKPELAKRFIEFLLSDDFQNFIPDQIWMYPANSKTHKGKEYDFLPFSKKDYSTILTQKTIGKRMDKWMESWKSIMLK